MHKPIINIGILSHVDAGKTTITENLLFVSGAIRQKGNVDSGSTITDSMDIEKRRGISIKSSSVSLDWKGVTVNILDTPGHVDFAAEVERVLSVLDRAIVVVSAVEGVQAHTITLVEILKEMNIPFIVFINKIDRDGADVDFVLNSLKKELSLDVIPYKIANEKLELIPFWEIPETDDGFERIVESIAEYDDELMNKYLEGDKITKQDLEQSGIKSIKKRLLVPALSGIAKNGIGMEELLDAVVDILQIKKNIDTTKQSALVYKVEYHKKYGKIAHIRVYSGSLKAKELIINTRLNKEIKLGVLKKISLNKLIDTPVLEAGEIGIITSVDDIQTGDFLGYKPENYRPAKLLESVMTTVIKPKEEKDFNKLNDALSILNIEDPLLNLKWYKQDKEFHINIIGPIQIEIIEEELKERFGLDVTFANPTVIYKERPIKKAKGFVRYWMPKPCWAIMTFEIEPGEIGSGIKYKSIVRQSDIHLKYQNEVERTIPKVLKQGIKGWEVTDIQITLISGEDHNIHSRPGDFELATYMGIMRALDNAGTELLEPILSFTINAPEELLGKIASDLTRMRAQFANPDFENGFFSLSGTIPAATSMNYSIKLNSLTSGKGRIRTKFKGYDICPPNEGEIREYKGVNPLDEALWILHRRGAYKGEEREK